MRVLHVSHQYPPAIGGSEKYIADLSEELVARGHQVDVYTSRSLDFHTWRNELGPFENRNGVNIYRFRSLRRRGYVWRTLHFGLRHYWAKRARLWEPLIFLGGGPLCPGMFWQMLRNSRQYDLIHLNCLVYAHVTYGYWATSWRDVPVVVTPHAHVEQEVTYNIGYQRQVLAGADYIFADTPAEETFLKELRLNPRICTIGVGLLPHQYPRGVTKEARRQMDLPQDKFIILFFSRKSGYKGLEIALQAFEYLQAQGSEATDLFFVAAGPETAESRAMWPRYEHLPNLHVLNSVSDEEKVALLQACDCLVLPSVGEAFGIVFLEAWMMGKPVIGARTVAVSAVISEGEDGLLAAPRDIAELAQAIVYLQRHSDQAEEMGRRGRAKVMTNYTVPRITDHLEDAYRQVLARKGGKE